MWCVCGGALCVAPGALARPVATAFLRIRIAAHGPCDPPKTQLSAVCSMQPLLCKSVRACVRACVPGCMHAPASPGGLAFVAAATPASEPGHTNRVTRSKTTERACVLGGSRGPCDAIRIRRKSTALCPCGQVLATSSTPLNRSSSWLAAFTTLCCVPSCLQRTRPPTHCHAPQVEPAWSRGSAPFDTGEG